MKERPAQLLDKCLSSSGYYDMPGGLARKSQTNLTFVVDEEFSHCLANSEMPMNKPDELALPFVDLSVIPRNVKSSRFACACSCLLC